MRPGRLLFVLLAVLFGTMPLAAQPKEKPKWPPSPHIANTDPLRPEEQIKKIKLPPGFELQLVAADPDIRKPININFDAAGRLWLTETIEYPFPAKAGEERDAVKILEDFGPDGKARKITTFADKLNIPIGVLPDGDGRSALVYTIPAIYRMSDTKGVGKADKRDLMYGGFGHDDTHGMTGEFQMGFDGWIYACHGYRNRSTVKSRGDTAITMESGNTYRIKPDGSRVEQWTWGQVNPFGLAFDPYGNLYSGDCHSQPLTMLLRHGWYVSFNRPNDGLGFAPHMNTFGKEHSTALCGVAYYAADQYPPEYRGKLFLGDVVENRINAYRIDWNGASPKATFEPFLTSSDPWFRPVDIKLGPDGCLYFADFYNRIIGHYEVDLRHPGRDHEKGRIWRIVYRGKDGKSGPQPVANLATADAKTLVAALGSPNLTVRLQATHRLVEVGGDDVLSALKPVLMDSDASGHADKKVHALWVLHRLGKLDNDTLAQAASAKEKIVRVHALRILSEKVSWPPRFAALAKAGLEDKEPMVQRVAAEAMAAHPSPDHVVPLARARFKASPTDAHLIYAIRLAMRDQLQLPESWEATKKDKFDRGLRMAIFDVCLALKSEQSVDYMKLRLAEFLGEYRQQLPDAIRHIVRYGAKDSAGWTLAFAEKEFAKDLNNQAVVLRATLQGAQERGVTLSKDERRQAEDIVGRLLEVAPSELGTLKTGAELAELLKAAKSQPRLLTLATTERIDPAVSRACVKALINIDAKQSCAALGQVLLDDKIATGRRGVLARELGSTNHPEAQSAILKAFQIAPARMETDLAIALTGSKAGCEKLLAAIDAGKAPMSAVSSRPVALNFQTAKVDLDGWLTKRGKAAPSLDKKTQDTIAKRRDAFATFKSDAAVGQKIFAKSCAVCHQIGGQGAKVGPNLDGIGTRGLERLLEDVLDPNRNIDQAFRTTVIVTKGGLTVTGLFLREEGNVVILGDKDGKDVRVEKSQIDERTVVTVSPMPGNFLEILSEPELHHLMAYMLAQRGKQ